MHTALQVQTLRALRLAVFANLLLRSYVMLSMSWLLPTLHCLCADLTARGDAIMWVHSGQRPVAGTCAALDDAIRWLQELQLDLSKLLQLRRRTAEYQVP